jgi:hypothetical protein
MRRRIGPNPRRIRLSVRVSHPRMEVRQVRSVSLDTPDPFTSAHLTHKHCIQKRRARIESIDRKLCDISQCLNTTTIELQSWDSRAPTPQQDNNSNDSNCSTNTSYKLPKLSLNNNTTIICFLAEFGVLVCKQHRTAVVNLDVHLRDQHATPAVLQKQIIEQLCNFTTTNLRAVKLLEQPAQPIQELGTPHDGFKCTTCEFITVARRWLKLLAKRCSSSVSTPVQSATLCLITQAITTPPSPRLRRRWILTLPIVASAAVLIRSTSSARCFSRARTPTLTKTTRASLLTRASSCTSGGAMAH